MGDFVTAARGFIDVAQRRRPFRRGRSKAIGAAAFGGRGLQAQFVVLHLRGRSP
jgi:hypothetical protein